MWHLLQAVRDMDAGSKELIQEISQAIGYNEFEIY